MDAGTRCPSPFPVALVEQPSMLQCRRRLLPPADSALNWIHQTLGRNRLVQNVSMGSQVPGWGQCRPFQPRQALALGEGSLRPQGRLEAMPPACVKWGRHIPLGDYLHGPVPLSQEFSGMCLTVHTRPPAALDLGKTPPGG